MIEFSVRRPVAVAMICIGLVVLGLIAARRIPVQLLPNIQTPEFTIVTELKGATPGEIESMVTTPVERAVSTIGGLEGSESESQRERSEIHLKFRSNINYLETISAMRERLDSAGLPEGSTRPKILRFQANSTPVIRLALKPNPNSKTPMLELTRILQDTLIRQIESVDGVAMASLLGAPTKSLELEVDPGAGFSYGVTLPSIVETIKNHNRSYPGGEIEFEGRRTSVKLGQGIHSKDELEKLVVKNIEGRVIRLGDIAQIKEVISKPSVRTHLQGMESLVVDVRKEAEANSVQVAETVKEIIRKYLDNQSSLLQGQILFDQGEQIKLAVDNVGHSVFHGGVLAGFVIFLLLQNWWPTFIVSVSMPLSILITFILMYFTGISFNLMSLAGLALGVGMLVDNSTVVLDSIHLHQTKNKDKRSAALWGTKTVVGAITGSTLSIIAVFGPLAFVEGIIGQIFRDVAATICYSLAASLFSSVFLIPMLSAAEFNHGPPEEGKQKENSKNFLEFLNYRFYQGGVLKNLADFYLKSIFIARIILININKFIYKLIHPLILFAKDWIVRKYNAFFQPLLNFVSIWIFKLEQFLKTILPQVIRDSKSTVYWAVGLTLGGVAVLAWRGAELFPEEVADRLEYELEFAPGQTLDLTEGRIASIEKKFLNTKGIISVSSMVGNGGSHHGRLTFQVNERDSIKLNRIITPILLSEPGAAVNRFKEALVGEGKPIQIEIYNDNIESLKNQAHLVKSTLEKITGLADVETNVRADLTEVVIHFSKDKLSWFGTSAANFISLIKPLLAGESAGLLQWKGDELPVNVKIPERFLSSIDKIKYLTVSQDDGKNVYLNQVSDVNEEKTVASIKHKDRKRMATVAANLAGEDLQSVSVKIKRTIDKNLAKDKINWNMGGEDKERQRSQKSLLIAVALSIFLIYLMLAAQFENLVQPIIILSAVPFCISGIAVFLLLFNLNLSALVFVGFIILVGVSVNTSIVMVDFANQLVSEGRSVEDSIAEATVRRMRPILVTTLSAVLGLLPMAFAFGQGSAMQQPLAVTMIGGHLSSTVLTMLFVPILYTRLAKAAQIESKA